MSSAVNIHPITFGNFKDFPLDRKLKERYWKFLFDNLQRAVDELYATCETDESIVQCKEVVMVLEKCTKDFNALIERFKLLQNFEQADSDNKPSSLTWDVRPSIPVPKTSESPRPGVRLSKRTLFAVSCIPSASGSQNNIQQVSENNTDTPAVKESCSPLSQIAVAVSDSPLVDKVFANLRLPNNENKIQESEDGWRVVKTNKKGRLMRKVDSTIVSETMKPVTRDDSKICDVEDVAQTSYRVASPSTQIMNDHPIEQVISRSRTSTLSNADARRNLSSLPAFFQNAPDCDIDMDLSIELDEALMSALTAEDELNNELRDELNESVKSITDDPDLMDDQSDSWLSASVDSVRIPGRGVELHEKLLSPARRGAKAERTTSDEFGRANLAEQLAEKQLKVMELREKRQQDKIERCTLLSKRVEEVRSWKNELINEKKRAIEAKMHAAEQRRLSQLQQIVRKAHDEEAKGSEIAFINNIEAESRKLEVQTKYHMWRKRLLELADEQNKRRDATASRKSAASDRKRALDAERHQRMQELLEKQKERERKAEERQVEKLQERVAFSRAREREHEERVEKIRMADEKLKQQLLERINLKSSLVEKRHSEQLEQRRERAVALSAQSMQSPRHQTPTTKHVHSNSFSGNATSPLLIDQRKYCQTCQTVIDSDMALIEHLKNRQHRQQCNVSKSSLDLFCLASMLPIVPLSSNLSCSQSSKGIAFSQPEYNVDTVRQSLRKRAKKYKQRLNMVLPLEDQMQSVCETGRLGTVFSELDRLISSLNSTQSLIDRLLAVERLVLEITRLVEKQAKKDFHAKFVAIKGHAVLNKVILKYSPFQSSTDVKSKQSSVVENSDRLINAVLQCYVTTFLVNHQTCLHLLCCEPALIPVVFEMMTNAVEGLAITAVNQLCLSGPIFDAVQTKLLTVINFAVSFFEALSLTLATNSSGKIGNAESKEITRRCLDCLNLLVANGFVDKTAQIVAVATYLTEFGDDSVCTLLNALSGLLTASCRLVMVCCPSDATERNEESLLFVSSLRFTDLSGLVSLVYALMLKETGLGKPSSAGEPATTDIPKHVVELALQSYRFLAASAALDPVLLQTTLSNDAPVLLQFRQASAYILSQAGANNLTRSHLELIDEVIICIGLFALLNHPLVESNLASGQPPTVLQQLCQLPIKYFTDDNLRIVLIPTLIAVTFKCDSCLAVLKSELSPQLLARFLQDQISKADQVVLNFNQPSVSCRFPPKYWKEALQWLSPAAPENKG